MGRLALLETELKPVVRQAPPGVDLFDLTLSPGEHPRLFLDMVAFVEMGRDRRSYRFFQDTLHGRVLIAESQQIDRIVAAVTNYVARRLVERERALAAEGLEDAPQPKGWPTRPAASAADPAFRWPDQPESEVVAQALAAPARARASWGGRIGSAFAFLLMTLGSVTLICLLSLALVPRLDVTDARDLGAVVRPAAVLKAKSRGDEDPRRSFTIRNGAAAARIRRDRRLRYGRKILSGRSGR